MLETLGRTLVFFGLGLFGLRGTLDLSAAPLSAITVVVCLTVALIIHRLAETSPRRIGDLAVSHGILTRPEVEYIPDCQSDCGQRFGEIALEKSLLTTPQLNRLLGHAKT